jgi:trehalose utilization protein
MSNHIRVTIWNEFRHEKKPDHPARLIYPEGMHAAIAAGLSAHADFKVRTATLDEPEQGLSDAILNDTDVLLWWGHDYHHEVSDALVDKLQLRVLSGMGLIVLHSGHYSKIFKRLMGTTCSLKWREANDNERIWVVEPGHPIAVGLGEAIEIGPEEMYGERFDIPAPDALVLVSWFTGGEIFRTGCCWQRGNGRVFYFRPGHESYPTYFNADVRRILANACRWAAPSDGMKPPPDAARPAKPREALPAA